MDTIRGLIRLARMLLRTRGASGAYWAWRSHTAFADRPPRSIPGRLHAVIHLARWMGRMSRLGRS